MMQDELYQIKTFSFSDNLHFIRSKINYCRKFESLDSVIHNSVASFSKMIFQIFRINNVFIIPEYRGRDQCSSMNFQKSPYEYMIADSHTDGFVLCMGVIVLGKCLACLEYECKRSWGNSFHQTVGCIRHIFNII